MLRWLCIAAVSGAAAKRLANESGLLVFRHVAPASGASICLSTPADSTATAHDKFLCETGITPNVQVLLCFALRTRLQAALQPNAAGAGAAAGDVGTAAGAATQRLARAAPPAADLEPQVPICRFTGVLAERMGLTVNMEFQPILSLLQRPCWWVSMQILALLRELDVELDVDDDATRGGRTRGKMRRVFGLDGGAAQLTAGRQLGVPPL